MCRETGWSVEYILSMPARRFFVLRKSMFDILREEKYSNLMELCDVQFISVADQSYYSELRDYYRSSLNPEFVRKKLNSRQFDMENGDERKKVDDILSATFKQKARLMGLA